jgi:hypothetical protein
LKQRRKRKFVLWIHELAKVYLNDSEDKKAENERKILKMKITSEDEQKSEDEEMN